jgi:hypothetical protein
MRTNSKYIYMNISRISLKSSQSSYSAFGVVGFVW